MASFDGLHLLCTQVASNLDLSGPDDLKKY